MLRMNKDYSDYEIDRELTGKYAIKSNAELQDEYFKLRKEHKRLKKEHNKLQVEHSRILFDIDAVIEGEVKKKYKSLTEKCKELEERIDVMQELIDYNEGVVQNAIGMLYTEGKEEKALDYLEVCYATGDEKLYEEMEKIDKGT